MASKPSEVKSLLGGAAPRANGSKETEPLAPFCTPTTASKLETDGQGQTSPGLTTPFRSVIQQYAWEIASIPNRHAELVYLNGSSAIDRRGGVLDEAIEATRQFAQWPWGAGMYLFGPPGCGKTLLSVLTLRGMLISGREYGWPVVDGVRMSWENWERASGGHVTFWQPIFRFVNTPRLLHEIKSTFQRMSREEPDTESVLSRYETADALVLDDIGREKPTDWVRETLFLLIDARYNARRPTIFTSNYHPRELAERLSEPIADRILEMCRGCFVQIKAGSYR